MSAGSDELVTLLSSGLSRRQLYFSGHPRVIEACREFLGRMEDLFETKGTDGFFLGVVDGSLVHEGQYLVGPTIVGQRLVEFVERLRSGGLLFKKGAEAYEIAELVGLGAELRDPLDSIEEARGMLRSRGVKRIEVSPEYGDPDWFGRFMFDRGDSLEGGATRDAESAELVEVCQSLYTAVEMVTSDAASHRALDIAGVQTVCERMLRTTEVTSMDVMRLVRYPDYDTYTIGHSVRVALIAVLLARKLGASLEMLMEVGTAGLLHDIGKAKIPQEILFKPGRLDQDERRAVERHAGLGAELLLENRDVSSIAVCAAWGHHVRADRRGYPRAPQWGARSRVTSLLQVADVFEALTAVRPYKPAYSPRRAYEIMLEDAGAFDPGLLDTLISAMGLYPPGSRVRLSDGRIGVVFGAGQEIDRPQVRIVPDGSTTAYGTSDSEVIDIGASDQQHLSVSNLLAD